MSIQHKVEFRVTKAAIIKDVIVSIVLVLFFAIPAWSLLQHGEAWFAAVLMCIALVVALVMARAVYWEASLSYIVSDEGLTIRDYRGDKHLKWDEIAGIRLVPFTGTLEMYNLELKNGKTQKLNMQVERGFMVCVRFERSRWM
jgi:hypothetical protein